MSGCYLHTNGNTYHYDGQHTTKRQPDNTYLPTSGTLRQVCAARDEPHSIILFDKTLNYRDKANGWKYGCMCQTTSVQHLGCPLPSRQDTTCSKRIDQCNGEWSFFANDHPDRTNTPCMRQDELDGSGRNDEVCRAMNHVALATYDISSGGKIIGGIPVINGKFAVNNIEPCECTNGASFIEENYAVVPCRDAPDDVYGDAVMAEGCLYYEQFPHNCGVTDTADFNATERCCVCATGPTEFKPFLTTRNTCDKCAPGLFQTQGKQFNTCAKCPAGFFNPDVDSVCIECPAGYIQYSTGKAFCDACATQTYSGGLDGVGGFPRLKCADCPSGYHSSSTPSDSCSSCPAGQYVNAGGCAGCAEGKYSAAGAGSCTTCAAGKYSNTAHTSCALSLIHI